MISIKENEQFISPTETTDGLTLMSFSEVQALLKDKKFETGTGVLSIAKLDLYFYGGQLYLLEKQVKEVIEFVEQRGYEVNPSQP